MNTPVYHYLLLPLGGKHVLWVQGPLREWMLLAGQWSSKNAGEAYAKRAGYFEATDKNAALSEIESQMETRLVKLANRKSKTSH